MSAFYQGAVDEHRALPSASTKTKACKTTGESATGTDGDNAHKRRRANCQAADSGSGRRRSEQNPKPTEQAIEGKKGGFSWKSGT